MAQFPYRLNVGASAFPFISDQLGQTVVVANQDMYYIRPNAFTGEGADKNLGIPQLIFCENTMPSTYGVQSVGFTNNTTQFPGGLLQADKLTYLRGQTGRRYLVNYNRQNGKFFIYSPEISAWILVLTVATPNSQFSTAMVKGRCFFYFQNTGALFEFKGFNTTSNLFQYVIMSGVTGISDLTPMFGICSANNYLLFFTRTAIYYTIPTEVYGSLPDFTPSLGPTGAAAETPSVLKGIILTMLPTQDGFYIFTSTNIIAAFYSGNIKFPWTYRELDGSAAIISVDTIAVDRDQYPRYAYTTAGLIKIGKSSCTPAVPEASEFIGGKLYEYFDWPSKTIKRRALGAPMHLGFSYVAGRWLVISYGAQGEYFTHAILWDEHLKKWGKIQRNHASVIEFFGVPATIASTLGVTYQDLLNGSVTYQNLLDQGKTYADLGGVSYSGNPDIALEYASLGFITADGVVQLVNFDVNVETDQSVAIWGRVQFTRSHRTEVLSVWAENIFAGTITAPTKLAVLSTNDGKTPGNPNYGFAVLGPTGNVKQFNYSRAEGINHYFRFEGDFDISTIVVVTRPTGRALA